MSASLSVLLAALAICESGSPSHPTGTDRAVGRSKEVSRYQVKPSVWRDWASKRQKPTSRADATLVAGNILQAHRLNFGTSSDAFQPTQKPTLFGVGRASLLNADTIFGRSRRPSVPGASGMPTS